jgi:hypothetical protein
MHFFQRFAEIDLKFGRDLHVSILSFSSYFFFFLASLLTPSSSPPPQKLKFFVIKGRIVTLGMTNNETSNTSLFKVRTICHARTC